MDEQNSHPIFNGRPTGLHGPPIEIYNDILANLKHGLCDLSNAPEPSAGSSFQTSKLFEASTRIYKTEDRRVADILNPLSRLMGNLIERSVKLPRKEPRRCPQKAMAPSVQG
jgi:hypothetical protein